MSPCVIILAENKMDSQYSRYCNYSFVNEYLNHFNDIWLKILLFVVVFILFYVNLIYMKQISLNILS